MTELVRRDTQLELFRFARVTDTSLVVSPDATYDAWLHIGDTLARIGRAHQWWIGDWLRHGEHQWGTKYEDGMARTGLEYQTLRDHKWVAESVALSLRNDKLEWSHHKEVASLAPTAQEKWLGLAEEHRWSVRELRQQIRGRQDEDPPPPPAGKYRCIVADPPWYVEKITREVRPKQGPGLDYPTLTVEQVTALPVPSFADEDCHLYLWTTHRYLPQALEIACAWGFTYQCLMTWVKNVGITPFSWMYDTEHVIFAKRGSLDLKQLGLRLSFSAPVTKHSEKPAVFYERVLNASPGPRIELFARSERDGFTAWGNEIAA
jgi:N6-adenosine-specific RNA methylase IME4